MSTRRVPPRLPPSLLIMDNPNPNPGQGVVFKCIVIGIGLQPRLCMYNVACGTVNGNGGE